MSGTAPGRETPPGRVVIVTGAFGTLGLAVARAFSASGDRVALLDRAEGTRALRAEFAAPNLVLGGTDLTDLDATADALALAVRELGRPSVLVNVAGGFCWQPFRDSGLDAWDRMYAMNLRTALVATKTTLPHLSFAGGGRIVNIGAAAAAERSTHGMGAYVAAKRGVHALTESLADELKDIGITVNAVLPGIIDTPQNRAAMPDADTARWVSPEAVAAVVQMLASASARAVSGACLPVLGRR